ncbi:hypothetical protein [uncultured Sphingobium sp.]|uniref:hypothetical protein n=1 Tax=uncultured Sphingobium sp. TaxID=316087 RepID=UPI002606B6D8|nr:hypothetical protein [uncultured Sphingobium sp.]
MTYPFDPPDAVDGATSTEDSLFEVWDTVERLAKDHDVSTRSQNDAQVAALNARIVNLEAVLQMLVDPATGEGGYSDIRAKAVQVLAHSA